MNVRPKNSAIPTRCCNISCVFLLALFPLSMGCGNSMPSVTGIVKLDGQIVRGTNLIHCTVLFHPESGAGAPAVARVDDSGTFSLATGSTSGVLEGTYGVAISVKEITPATDGGLPTIRRLSPQKYSDPSRSGWNVEVGPGSNEFEFVIDSGM